MSRLRTITSMVATLPSTGFVKLGQLIRQRDAMLTLEKTAEISQSLATREAEILSSFYKLSFKWLDRLSDLPIREAEKHIASSPHTLGVMAQEARPKAMKGLDDVSSFVKKHPWESAGIAGVGAIAYNNSKQAEDLQAASALACGGQALGSLYSGAPTGDLSKLAAIGAINAKLQRAMRDPACPHRTAIQKLGEENNRHCLDILTKLAGPAASGAGLQKAEVTAASSIKNAFGGGKKAPAVDAPAVRPKQHDGGKYDSGNRLPGLAGAVDGPGQPLGSAATKGASGQPLGSGQKTVGETRESMDSARTARHAERAAARAKQQAPAKTNVPASPTASADVSELGGYSTPYTGPAASPTSSGGSSW